ncbi:hypothetical protein BC829DRAFT_414513 [Chytridium lagenaria]|nr:hypothetical protein BC829DRAFT_414513 [Chytridium lagenaria]
MLGVGSRVMGLLKGLGEKKYVRVMMGTLLHMNKYKEILSYASLMTLKYDELQFHLTKRSEDSFFDLAHIEYRIFETFKRSSHFHGPAIYTKSSIYVDGNKFAVTAMEAPKFMKSKLEAFEEKFSEHDLFSERRQQHLITFTSI